MKIGTPLRRLRAGTARSIWNDPEFAGAETVLLSSKSFSADGPMGQAQAGRGVGENVSPELHWSGVPTGAAALVLILEDVDVPVRSPLLHTAAVFPPDATGVAEGDLVAENHDIRLIPVFFGRAGYVGPTPIPGHGPHRYRFLLFALSRPVPETGLKNGRALRRAMSGAVLARGMTVGTYEL